MSLRAQRVVILVALLLVLAAANVTVARHERTLAEGRVMYLELAPVDPRSIMQGDYMALRFAVASLLPYTDTPQHELLVVKRDARGVGTFVRMHRDEALAADEALLEYRIRKRGARIVTDAYHFQEGTAKIYEGARFGELRVRPDGVALLVRLTDAGLKPLGPSRFER